MKYIITGGSGFVGGHLIEKLLKHDPDAIIYNLDIVQPRYEHSNSKHIAIDIRAEEQLLKVEVDKVDICIHLAALCKEPGFEWDEYFETNYVGTKNIIKLCEKLGVQKILFTSTMMVYRAGDERRTEDSLTAPDTAYGISKLLAEKEIEKWAEKNQNRKYGVLRPSVVFGKYENGNFTRLYSALKRNRFVYVGRKTTVKSCVYVKDVCNAIIYLIDKDIHDIFNFAFINDYQISKIVESFKRVFGFKAIVPIIPLPFLMLASKMFLFLNQIGIKNSIHPRRIQKLYYSSNISSQKIILFGYKFEYDLELALQDWKDDCKCKNLY